jgi:hypothetical protein
MNVSFRVETLRQPQDPKKSCIYPFLEADFKSYFASQWKYTHFRSAKRVVFVKES